MREILFRGKRLDNGEWVLSGNIIRFIPENGEDLIFIPALSEPCTCYHDEKENIIAFEKGIFYKVDTKTVGQYTGLKDKNGKRIFEGDIVNLWWEPRTDNQADEFKKYKAVIEFGNPNFIYSCGWQLKMIDNMPFNNDILLWVDMEESGAYIEVIGNVHDNPELLEK